MDPVTAAVVTAVTQIAIEVTKETATHVTKAAWKKLKDALGWTVEPAAAEVQALAERTLAANPALATQVQQIVNDYRQQVGGVSVGTQGSMDLRGATVGTVKDVNIGHNSGTMNF